jgi:hypothetical protein
MSLRDKILGRPEAVAKSRKADAALHANQRADEAAGIHEETPEYLRLNAAAVEAAAELPRWRR